MHIRDTDISYLNVGCHLRTLVEGSYIVGYDGNDHRIIRDGVVVYEGNEVKHIGKQYLGTIDRKIDARENSLFLA
jgi:hypothetical protein